MENLKKENKSEITRLLNDKKRKEEEENQKNKDEEEKQRKIKENQENKRKKDEEEKQRKMKEELEKKRKKDEEEKQRKMKEEQEIQRKKEEEKKKNDMKKRKEKEQFDKNLHYSFECTNEMILQQYIYQGTDTAEMTLMLKNTGLSPWPPHSTKLIFDTNHQIGGKSVAINSLQKNEEQKCVVKVEGLSNLALGEYDAGVYLNINGNNIGKMIKMKVIIIKREVDPIEKHKDLIKKFREEYNLDENQYPDNDLYDILLSHDFKFEKAFMCLIGEDQN